MNATDLFIECVKSIKRYPRMGSLSFPTLPRGCYFVIAPPYTGQYQIDVDGVMFDYKHYLYIKKALV